MLGVVSMARKNSVTKRKKYNEYLVEEEKKRQQERKEKMEQMKKVKAPECLLIA